MHAHIHIHAHTLTHMHIHSCMYNPSIHIQTHSCTYSCTHACTLTLSYTLLTHTCTCIHSLHIHIQLFIQALSLTCTHRYTQPNLGPPLHSCLKVPTHILCSLGAQPLGERFKGIQYCDRHIICLRRLIRVLRNASSGCLCACSVVLSSLRPHGLLPTRLLCPGDFPGKNTGVGCCFLLQGIFPLRDWTHVSCVTGRFFTTEPSGKTFLWLNYGQIKSESTWGLKVYQMTSRGGFKLSYYRSLYIFWNESWINFYEGQTNQLLNRGKFSANRQCPHQPAF